jgi:hypothetical protein
MPAAQEGFYSRVSETPRPRVGRGVSVWPWVLSSAVPAVAVLLRVLLGR